VLGPESGPEPEPEPEVGETRGVAWLSTQLREARAKNTGLRRANAELRARLRFGPREQSLREENRRLRERLATLERGAQVRLLLLPPPPPHVSRDHQSATFVGTRCGVPAARGSSGRPSTATTTMAVAVAAAAAVVVALSGSG
jgi:hypothetical protein